MSHKLLEPRPEAARMGAASPASAEAIDLLGAAEHWGPLGLTHRQLSALLKLYRHDEPLPAPLDLPNVGARPRITGKLSTLVAHGSLRNTKRLAEHDGLRMVAWFAKYCEPGDDPVRVLVRLVMAAGWDVDAADACWAEGDDGDADLERMEAKVHSGAIPGWLQQG